jgi:hypothetical protein
MDSALAGVLGVVGGSVASVGAQLALGWRTRRTDSIAGARIIYSALADSAAVLHQLKQPGHHPRATITTNLAIYEAMWDEHQSALARAANIEAFHLIQVAFVDVRHIRDALTTAADNADLNERASRVVADPCFGSRVERIKLARNLAFKEGTRLLDKPRLALMNLRDKRP